MKYNNIAGKIRFVYIFFHIVSLFAIIMIWLTHDILIDKLVLTIGLSICMIMYNVMCYALQDLIYFSYIMEDKISQRFLCKKKEILYHEVKYLFFVDNLLILSPNNEFNIKSDAYSFSEKKMIKKQLKKNVVIWIDLSNKFFSNIIMDKCKSACVIKIGKISKYIEKEFEI